MPLGSALVDLAYPIRSKPTARKVDGRTMRQDTEGPAFKARLELATDLETRREGQTTTDPRPHLLVGPKDSEGAKLEFRTSDRIRVVSAELGEAIWEVEGDPVPLRKRKKVLGWELTLHRVVEQDAEDDRAV